MRVTLVFVLLYAAVTVSGEDPGRWYPSQHGAGDTLGAINHLSAEKVV